MTRGDRVEDRARGDDSTSLSLLSEARHDDPVAWARLVHLYAPLVAFWCRRWGVAGQDVVDLVQEVFAAVARNLDRFHKDRPSDTFRGWLSTIARNRVRDYYRRRADQPTAMGGTEALLRFAQIQDPESCADLPDESDDPGFSELLSRGLESIRGDFHEQTWRAFWGVVVEGRTTADVAADLNMRVGTVRVAKSRVLLRLRRELGDIAE